MKILLFVFLLACSVAFGQDKKYEVYLQTKDLIFKKSYAIEKRTGVPNAVKYLDEISDTLKDRDLLFDIELLKIRLFERSNDFENYYRGIINVDKLVEKHPDTSKILRSKLVKANMYSALLDTEKSIEILKECEKYFTPNIKKNNVDILLSHARQSFYCYSNLNNEEKKQYFADKGFKIASKLDTTRYTNFYNISIMAIGYGDFIDSKDQAQSFSYYKKANRFAHKLDHDYLINFSRLRLSGCLMYSQRANQALDTLREITKSSNEFNVNLLHYYNYVTVFEILKEPDSVAFYKTLIEEAESVQIDVLSSFNKKREIEKSINKVNIENKKASNNEKLLNLFLIATFLLGLFTLGFILFKLKYSKSKANL